MNYKQLDITHSYISQGNNNITDSFLNPVLKYTKEYKRSVGFFSSSVLDTVMDGIVALVRNGGKVKLIASPKLSEVDAQIISMGYENRKNYYSNIFTDEFKEELNMLNNQNLQLLFELIKKGVMDIKIAVTDGGGMYHDKLGILKDFEGNIIAFYGSANSSYSGYRSNYEKIRISKSWDPGAKDIVESEEVEFDNLWNNTNKFVEVYEYTEIATQNILEIIVQRETVESSSSQIQLRDYQETAINKWVENNYRGFYVMATGTGKTWTAIYSAKRLIETHPCLVTICAPYKHLVKQWSEDVVATFPEASIILVSSENQGWDQQISDAIIRSRYKEGAQIIIISTIASFKSSRFIETLKKFEGDKLLIVDEAHRFTVRPDNFEYMLGLSATPFSGASASKGNELMAYFGGQVFSLPIEEALERKFLVPYYYYPIYVYATDEEEKKFISHSKMILSCFRNGQCINPDFLVKTLRNRLRIISMAENKQNQLDYIINKVEDKDHVVVYCGDGKLFDDERGEELRHIESVKKVLNQHEYKASQFTAQENMNDRMKLVKLFNKGAISALAAIRCLDEGINIPSIKSALILSSNDDYREFVQRRGRILRTYGDKTSAKIYDVVVLPKTNLEQWAKIELRRFYEYAKLSLNWNELEEEFTDMLIQYDMTLEDVDTYDYDEKEDYEDE